MGSTKIHLKQDLKDTQGLFLRSKQEGFVVRLTVSEQADFYSMLGICMASAQEELEVFVLREVQQIVQEKFEVWQRKGFVDKHKAGTNFRFRKSETFAIFFWMNEFHFDHPLMESLSANIVNQVYKQLL